MVSRVSRNSRLRSQDHGADPWRGQADDLAGLEAKAEHAEHIRASARCPNSVTSVTSAGRASTWERLRATALRGSRDLRATQGAPAVTFHDDLRQLAQLPGRKRRSTRCIDTHHDGKINSASRSYQGAALDRSRQQRLEFIGEQLVDFRCQAASIALPTVTVSLRDRSNLGRVRRRPRVAAPTHGRVT
jgi:hypothetical protein